MRAGRGEPRDLHSFWERYEVGRDGQTGHSKEPEPLPGQHGCPCTHSKLHFVSIGALNLQPANSNPSAGREISTLELVWWLRCHRVSGPPVMSELGAADIMRVGTRMLPLPLSHDSADGGRRERWAVAGGEDSEEEFCWRYKSVGLCDCNTVFQLSICLQSWRPKGCWV